VVKFPDYVRDNFTGEQREVDDPALQAVSSQRPRRGRSQVRAEEVCTFSNALAAVETLNEIICQNLPPSQR
jgi:hypothetical protein